MKNLLRALAIAACLAASLAHAAVINFEGPLKFADTDSGTGIYTGATTGTFFFGNIDDVTANGSITGLGITTPFTCCDAAGGLEYVNNRVLDQEGADDLNDLFDTSDFAAGQVYDTADLEGDAATILDGRIEVGLSFLFPASTYSNDDASNPLLVDEALRIAFFILEENSSGVDIYDAVGVATIVPVPAAVWLFASALGFMGWLRGRV